MFTRILTSTLLFLIAIGGFVANIELRNDNSNLGLSRISYGIANDAYADIAVDKDCIKGPSGDCKAATTESDDTKKMYNSLVAGLNIALAAINVVVAPAIILASWLMSPDWTSGDAFGLREVMHKIWIVVSNIIYFVYAVLLIMIALGTIFGRESFSYQKMLPKLALGILMVPFTWWFVQWTISLSTIVTASVLTIPQEAMKELQATKGESWWNSPSIPAKITYSPSEEKSGTKSQTVYENCEDKPSACITPQQFYENGAGMWSPLVIYSYSIFQFHKVKDLSKWQDGVSNVLQLVHQGIFSVLMLLVFGILVIALIFMLMVRAIKLWVYAIFSPLFTLHFVAGKEIMGKMGDGDDTFSIKEFIGLCFVPAIIGLTLSFGLIVLSMVMTPPIQSGTNTGNIASTDTKPISLFGNENNSIAVVDDKNSPKTPKTKDTLIKLGGMEITYKGGLGGGGGVATQNTLNSVFTKTGGFFGTIIIDIIALIFIWTAFMAAKNVNKAVGKAIAPFEDMGKKIGTMAASMPKYMPLPIPGGSVAGATRAVDIASQIPSKMSEERLKNSELGKLLKMGDQASPHDMSKMNGMLTDKDALQKIMRNGSIESIVMIKLETANSDKYGSEANLAKFAEEMKKKGGENEIFTYLKEGGMDEKNAKIIADEIAKGHTDPKSQPVLAKAWKEAAKSDSTAGTTGNTAGTNGIAITNVNQDKRTLTLNIAGGYASVMQGKIDESSLKNLTDNIKTKISTKAEDFEKDLTNQLTGAGLGNTAKTLAKEITEKLKSEKKFSETT